MRIFILGYMGCGKSTFGPELAKVMGLSYYDLDFLFEARYRISISDFFAKYGEKHFREIEYTLLSEIAEQDDFILSTGGGTPCYQQNMELMNSKGVTLYLKVPIDILLRRLKGSPRQRPILISFEKQGYEEQVKEHFKLREPVYMQSHLILDGNRLNATDIADQVRIQASQLNGG
jgi:shikimate kinase